LQIREAGGQITNLVGEEYGEMIARFFERKRTSTFIATTISFYLMEKINASFIFIYHTQT